MKLAAALAVSLASVPGLAAAQAPPGEERSPKTRVLETGAELLQGEAPVEILSGQLVAPGIPEAADHEAMAAKMNSYGKTWHVWKIGVHGEEGDELPLGEPHLAWSFNRDGEAKPGLVSARDEKVGVDTQEKRESRKDLVARAKPQCGVDALHGRFPGATTPLEGVRTRESGCPAP